MVTHLSVRLCWQDFGWNGRICKKPERNKYCICLDHIRKVKDKKFEDEVEVLNREKHLSELGYDVVTSFPCRGEICVLARALKQINL